jgi:hypothetical protein
MASQSLSYCKEKTIYPCFLDGPPNREASSQPLPTLTIQVDTYYRVLTMVYNTQRYWVFGLCPSSGFFLNK